MNLPESKPKPLSAIVIQNETVEDFVAKTFGKDSRQMQDLQKVNQLKESRMDRSEYESNLLKEKFKKHGTNWIDRIEPVQGGLLIKDPLVIPEPPLEKGRIELAIKKAVADCLPKFSERVIEGMQDDVVEKFRVNVGWI